MDDFSSLRFSKLFLSPTCRINIFEKIDIHYKIEESFDAVIEHVNDSDGLTVIGWYKSGRINNQMSNDETDNRVEAGDIGHHIVSIKPTNENITLDHLKFNACNLNDKNIIKCYNYLRKFMIGNNN